MFFIQSLFFLLFPFPSAFNLFFVNQNHTQIKCARSRGNKKRNTQFWFITIYRLRLDSSRCVPLIAFGEVNCVRITLLDFFFSLSFYYLFHSIPRYSNSYMLFSCFILFKCMCVYGFLETVQLKFQIENWIKPSHSALLSSGWFSR